jgi:predicted alpha/beta superfamily hydrolase
MRKTLPKLFVSFLFALVCFQAAKAQTPPQVELPHTQVLKYSSKIVEGQEYHLYINLPGNYTRDSTKSYPVLFLLDAHYDFPTFTGIYGSQYYDGFIPGFVTVGITWGGNNPNYGQLRARDLTPTGNEPAMGGGPKFLSFIKNELIPFINSKFRVTDDRALAGSSYGGLFTLYALYNEPGLFNRYIATSPSLTYDNSVLRTFEKKYAVAGSPKASRLYICRGGFEDLATEFNELTQRLKKVKNLDVQAMTLANTGHSGTKPEGFSRGLQWAFQRTPIKVNQAILQKYAGLYAVGNDTARLAVKNGDLVAISKPDDFVFQAQSENDFYHEGVFLNAHFIFDSQNKVSGLTLQKYEGEVLYKRVGD